MSEFKPCTRLIEIGAVCIAEIDNKFFLLVEIETPLFEKVIIFRISEAQATALLNRGVERCRIVEEIPEAAPGVEVEFICVFIVGSHAFLVFDVETRETDRLVLVRADICPILG
jgi:hypothetical protein